MLNDAKDVDVSEVGEDEDAPKAFDPSKVDAKHMRASIKAQKLLEHVHATTIEGAARDLISHYKRSTPADKLFPCSNCGGTSPAVLDDCPFCGFAGDQNDSEALSRADVRAVSTALARSPVVAVVPSSSSMLAGRAGQTDLDARVGRIQQLKAAGAVALWELGAELNRLKDEALWMLRTNPEGTKQKWKSFESFCHSELAMSPASAQELMRVARHYTRDDVAAFGTKKLLLALQAPKEERARVEQAIKSGGSKREIEKLVRKSNEGRETTARAASARMLNGKLIEAPARDMKLVTPLKKKEDERADTGASPEKGQKKITVANIVGVQRVKLFKKASMDMKAPDPKAGTRAKKVSDQPWGWLDLANGVRAFFQVQDSASGMELRVTIKRQED